MALQAGSVDLGEWKDSEPRAPRSRRASGGGRLRWLEDGCPGGADGRPRLVDDFRSAKDAHDIDEGTRTDMLAILYSLKDQIVHC